MKRDLNSPEAMRAMSVAMEAARKAAEANLKWSEAIFGVKVGDRIRVMRKGHTKYEGLVMSFDGAMIVHVLTKNGRLGSKTETVLNEEYELVEVQKPA